MTIIKVQFIFFSMMLIFLPYSHAETQRLAELVDVVVTEIEDVVEEVVEEAPLKTQSREIEFIADDEFTDFMHQYPGLIEKLQAERLAARSPYVLLPHRPNYFMPLSYQTKINQEEQDAFYSAVTADDGEVEQTPRFDHAEFVFQLSIKFVIANNVLGKFSSVAIAYTNKSFWQSYNDNISALFRETNHEPEIILGFRALEKWVDYWTLSFNHQSNGQLGNLSRSWNRIILGATKIWPKKVLYVRAWYRLPETSKADPMDPTDNDNPDITKFLGYGDVFYLSKIGDHSVSATFRNNLNFDENLGSIELDWTYPLPGNIKGFIQYFNGYGDSLIDYNQYQERIGIGIKITDWL